MSGSKPKAISLFSGCGGSDAGLLASGFEVVMANDVDEYARATYSSNLPETDYKCCDVGELRSFPEADLLAGCYPCQGFSQGGARVSDRNVNYLYREFDRALRLVRPKAFVVENVSGMQRADFAHLLKNQITRFRFAGYKVTWAQLRADDFDVAQERRRIFIVGIRSDFNIEYEFPAPVSDGVLKPRRTIRDAIGHLPDWPIGEYFEDKFHWYYMSRNRRRDWDEVSKTIVSHPRHMPLHPISPRMRRIHTDKWVWDSFKPARRYSYREAAILQGFHDGIQFPESRAIKDKYRVVGNAVPPPLFAAVARALPRVW